jgi:arginase
MTPREVTLVEVPYHLGHRGIGVGAGPAHLLDALGSPWPRTRVEANTDHTHEVKASFLVLAAAAALVCDVKRAGRLPIVFGGNCMTAIAACASDRRSPPAAVWFDAHGDFHTPETTSTGYLDGMALRMLTGGCWRNLLQTVPGFAPIAPNRVTFVGGHDLDPSEDALLQDAGVHVVFVRDEQDGLHQALDATLGDADGVYVHVDLDVLSADELRANQWAQPCGLSRAGLLDALARVVSRAPLAAVSITAYDPAWDGEQKGPDIVRCVLEALNPAEN